MEQHADKQKRDEQTRRAFGDWLRARLEERGYVLSPRGGGQSRFAEDSGIGRSTVGRILNGQGATDIDVLEQLARSLNVPYGEVIVRAGIISAADLAQVRAPAPAAETGRYLTAEEAADGLGFTDEPDRSVFIGMTAALQRQRQARRGDADRAAGT
ncbi:helix-turn-helix domain-containing protein [Streptomyces sp. NPDC059697]|uniref:helix-turn-helix domain-containing protein n=1 Tax=Streptomyces sp. NPDC059697 TaxID=3346912 RepID=UPI0036959125